MVIIRVFLRLKKTSLTGHYRHDKVKLPLFKAAHHKCAFCESIPADGGNYLQVEHFYPKSLYPEHCYSWENFLPACGKCNLAKSDFDTRITPIINPYNEDPIDFLTVKVLKIKPISNNEKAQTTIMVVRLNAPRLTKLRSDLLTRIQNLTEDIADKTNQYQAADSVRKKSNSKLDIEELVEELEEFKQPQHSQSFFCQQIIEDDDDYLAAKALLAA